MENIVNHYQSLWNLDNLTCWKRTTSGELYTGSRNGEDILLKVLNEAGLKDESIGFGFLNYYQGKGAVKVFDFVQQACLMKYQKGSDLSQFSKSEDEESTLHIFTDVISHIQSEEVLGSLPHIKTLLPGLEKTLHRLVQSRDPLAFTHLKKAYCLFEHLLASEVATVNLHGDLHHENIIYNDGQSYFIDPKGFKGDPCYELGTVLKNPWHYPKISQSEEVFLRRSEKLAHGLDLILERVRRYAFVHVALSLTWAMEDGGATRHQMALLGLMARHID